MIVYNTIMLGQELYYCETHSPNERKVWELLFSENLSLNLDFEKLK
jgi:hypothetical protein